MKTTTEIRTDLNIARRNAALASKAFHENYGKPTELIYRKRWRTALDCEARLFGELTSHMMQIENDKHFAKVWDK